MKRKIILTLLLIFSFLSINKSYGQGYQDLIDPKWDKYYDINPSGIDSNFKGIDFIKIIDLVNFLPRRSEIKGNVNLLKQVLLSFDFDTLHQMSMDGNFYSRTKKHDDYYLLYNILYNKIEKLTWDKYSPYLIALMAIDGSIKL